MIRDHKRDCISPTSYNRISIGSGWHSGRGCYWQRIQPTTSSGSPRNRRIIFDLHIVSQPCRRRQRLLRGLSNHLYSTSHCLICIRSDRRARLRCRYWKAGRSTIDLRLLRATFQQVKFIGILLRRERIRVVHNGSPSEGKSSQAALHLLPNALTEQTFKLCWCNLYLETNAARQREMLKINTKHAINSLRKRLRSFILHPSFKEEVAGDTPRQQCSYCLRCGSSMQKLPSPSAVNQKGKCRGWGEKHRSGLPTTSVPAIGASESDCSFPMDKGSVSPRAPSSLPNNRPAHSNPGREYARNRQPVLRGQTSDDLAFPSSVKLLVVKKFLLLQAVANVDRIASGNVCVLPNIKDFGVTLSPKQIP
nr:hypothetical protein Iba_chr12eCG7740 [Ipomoea batatas]